MTYVYPLPIAANTNDPSQTYHVKGATDLLAPSGTPIGSITEGTVISAGWDTLGGNSVVMHGLDGLVYYFAHMRDAPLVRAGEKVNAGQLLGYVGDTGNAKGGPTHLHIGIGHGISEGPGAAGGAGIGFDAQAFLHSLKAGGAGIAATASAAVMGGFPVYANQSPSEWITQVATALGIDPATALRAASTEGGTTEWDRVGDPSQGGSYGPFQLNYLPNSLGSDFTAATGIQPTDPRYGPASVVYALQWVKAHGWFVPGSEQGFHGPRNAGFSQWEGIGAAAGGIDPGTILGAVGGAIGDGVNAVAGAVGKGVGVAASVPGMPGLGIGVQLATLVAKAFGYDPGQISQQTIMDILILVIAIAAVLAGLWGIANSSGATKVALDIAKVAAEA